MYTDKRDTTHNGTVDYSHVTPATGTSDSNRDIAESFANQMPTSDTPAEEGSIRSDPDKTIPGSEAASGMDESEEAHTWRNDE